MLPLTSRQGLEGTTTPRGTGRGEEGGRGGGLAEGVGEGVGGVHGDGAGVKKGVGGQSVRSLPAVLKAIPRLKGRSSAVVPVHSADEDGQERSDVERDQIGDDFIRSLYVPGGEET
jgi:hypothetical protein